MSLNAANDKTSLKVCLLWNIMEVDGATLTLWHWKHQKYRVMTWLLKILHRPSCEQEVLLLLYLREDKQLYSLYLLHPATHTHCIVWEVYWRGWSSSTSFDCLQNAFNLTVHEHINHSSLFVHFEAKDVHLAICNVAVPTTRHIPADPHHTGINRLTRWL